MALPALIGALGRVAGTAATPTAAATGIQALTAKMNPLAQAVGGVQSAFGKLNTTTGQLASSAGLVTQPLQTVTQSLSKFHGAIVILGQQVSEFTKFTNPALTQRFQFAAEDLSAVIGKMLLPVLEFATKFTRMFADSLNQIAGPVQRLLATGLKPLSDLMPTLTNTLGPVLRIFGMLLDAGSGLARPLMILATTLLKIVALPLEMVFAGIAAAVEVLLLPLSIIGKLMTDLAQTFDRFISGTIAQIRKLLGLKTAAGSSEGAAFRSVSMGSTESFQQKAWTSAMGMGTAGPEERTADMASQLVKLVEGLPKAMWEYIQKLPGELADAIANGAKKKVQQAAQSAWDMVPDRPRALGGAATSGIGAAAGAAESGLANMADFLAAKRAELVAAAAAR